MPQIPKQLFIETIENLRMQLAEDKKNGRIIAEMFQCESYGTYSNNRLTRNILDLLRVWFPRHEDGYCPIENFIFMLNFGRLGLEEEEVVSVEDLWDELTKND